LNQGKDSVRLAACSPMHNTMTPLVQFFFK